MVARMTNIALIAAALVAVAACNAARVTGPETANPESDITPAAAAASDAVEAPVEQTLVYEWDTEFSAFLSPPIEVRRMARDDCVKAGYEVAVVGTLALEGNVARATYICRGDFE